MCLWVAHSQLCSFVLNFYLFLVNKLNRAAYTSFTVSGAFRGDQTDWRRWMRLGLFWARFAHATHSLCQSFCRPPNTSATTRTRIKWIERWEKTQTVRVISSDRFHVSFLISLMFDFGSNINIALTHLYTLCVYFLRVLATENPVLHSCYLRNCR